jgi:hypothetical protein
MRSARSPRRRRLSAVIAPFVDAARLARLLPDAPAHSGTPDITLVQWVILVRCRTNQSVPVEDILRSIRHWFEPALSIAEVTSAIATLTAARWLEFDESRQTARATAAGWAVVARLERPVGYADGWNIFAPPRDFDPDQVATGGSAGADRSPRPWGRDKEKGGSS